MNDDIRSIGIIGSGNIGTAVARLAVAAGLETSIANSRGSESLGELVTELGERAHAVAVPQAAEHSLVVLAVPLTAVQTLPPDLLDGRVVLDTSNYYPSRDGRLAALDQGELTTAEFVQRHLSGAHLVKAFSNILAHHIPQLARPAGATDRASLPVASNDEQAKAMVAILLSRVGFAAVDAGGLAEAWRFEPEAAGYTQLYLADPATPMEQFMTAPAAPRNQDEVRRALAGAERVDVARRQF